MIQAYIQYFGLNNTKAMNNQDNRVAQWLLSRVGNQGKYQQLSLTIFLVISLLGSSTFFVNTYLFYQPPYKCPTIQSPSECLNFVCSLPQSIRSQYASQMSITTLANYKHDTRCNGTSADVTAMQEAMLLGASLGLFVGVIVSDAIGRRYTMLGSIAATVLGLFMVLVAQGVKSKCLGLILWGSGSQISFTILFSYITETVSEEQRTKQYSKLNIAFAAGTIANTITFYIFRNWVLVLSLYYGLLYIAAFIAFYYYVESPPIEIISKSKDPQDAYQAFMRIAAINQETEHNLTRDEIQIVYEAYHKNQRNKEHGYFFTFVDIIRYPSLRIDFLKHGLSFFALMFLLYAPVLLLQKIVSNIFLNGLINGLSQFATIPILFSVNAKLSRRKGLMGMFGLFSLFTLLQFLINKDDCISCGSTLQEVFLLLCFFGARYFINLSSNFYSTTLNETFPSQIRGICACGVVGVGRLSTLAIPFIPTLKEQMRLSYNMIFFIVGLLGILASAQLKQTLNVLPPEMIEELKQDNQDYAKIPAPIQLQKIITKDSKAFMKEEI